jgi:hypothetical protein
MCLTLHWPIISSIWSQFVDIDNITRWNQRKYVQITDRNENFLKVALNTNDNNNMMLQKFEDTKGVIWSCKLKTDNTMATRKKGKRTNNDLQNTTQKTKESY